MAGIQQRGSSFLASVGSGASRIRQTFKTRAEAEAWIVSQEAAPKPAAGAMVPKAIREGTAKVTAREAAVTTFKALVDVVKRDCADGWGNDRSYSTHAINIGTALAFFGEDFELASFTDDNVAAYLADLEKSGKSDGTINRKVSALSKVLKYAKAKRWLSDLPNMSRREERGYRNRVIQPAEEAAILAYYTRLGAEEDADLYTVLVDCGLRVAIEGLRLEATDYRQLPFAHLYVRDGKGGKERTVPLTKRAKAAVERCLQRARLAGRTALFSTKYRVFLDRWALMAKALGLSEDPQFIPHICRHTYCSRLADAGVPAQKIQALAGHSRIETTMKYVHVSVASLEGTAEALETQTKGNQ